jgi:hypothetical protein
MKGRKYIYKDLILHCRKLAVSKDVNLSQRESRVASLAIPFAKVSSKLAGIWPKREK